MRNNRSEVDKGRIQLAESCLPPVKPGNITLSAVQKLSGDGKLNEAVLQEEHFVFTCEARGLNIEEDDIYSVYPPKGSFGRFETVLPHMVLRRKTLPWERKMQPEGIPWLALLLFSEDENARLDSRDVADAFQPGKEIYCPVTEKEGYGKGQSCLTLDVAADLFCAVCPDIHDLPLLTHVRCVNRDNKATEDHFQEEWLSVVTCNRLPCSNTKEEGLRNMVCLVSLEDFGTFLTNKELRREIASGSTWKKVRIPVLASYSFYSKKEDYNFAKYFHALTADAFRMPTDGAVATLPLLQRGFTAHNHMLRDGGRTVSFYHGPFLPWDAPCPEPKYEIFADARLIYQPEIGMFDASLSAAANLGRMLALQNEAFAAELLRFRKSNKQKAEEANYRKTVLGEVYGGAWKQGGKNENTSQSLDHFVSGLLMELLEKQRTGKTGTVRGVPREERTDTRSFCQTKNALLREGGYYGFLQEDAEIPKEITDFLAELSLLYSVPFCYLAPDEKMLPEDSIRFFRVDFNWLYALLDGAMSLGRNFQEDYEQDTVLIKQLISRIYEGRCRIRPALLRKSDALQKEHMHRCLTKADSEEAGQKNTGFLLRSDLVRGFRGLEFAAYEKKGDAEPLPCLRLEALGPDILLGIYAGECNYLEIRQPPEGMHFGMEKKDSGYQKRLRDPDTGELFADEEKNMVPIAFRDCGRGVMDPVKTAEGIKAKLRPDKVTSAYFALQMIQNPFTGIIEKK